MNNTFKSSLIPTKEEIEKSKRDALSELNKSNIVLSKERKRKVMIFFLVIIGIILAIKIFFGTIELNNIFGYPSNNARFYELNVNETKVNVSYQTKQQIPLIPFLINLNSYYLGYSKVNNDIGSDFVADDSKDYLININSYKCYSESGYQVECKKINQTMKLSNNVQYKKMIITRTTKPLEEVYNGKYINDITKYVDDKGVYCIQIYVKHSLVTDELYFYFRKDV